METNNSFDYTSQATNNNNYTLPKNLLLTRGFSKVQANEEILNETRNQIESTLKQNKNDSPSLHITEFSDYSFILPNLNNYTDEFREFLQNDLIEVAVQYSLSESTHLNWWSSNQYENVCRPLYPMVTSGDGNCLLHAASLGMWGLHDRYLILRKTLHSCLEQITPNSALYRRWKWEQMLQNKKYGLVLSEDEWAKEWSALLKLSSYQPRVQSFSNLNGKSISNSSININDTQQNTNNDGVYFESLEEFHVFVLAQIIQRPIIIVADKFLHDANGEPLAPIPFGGIYLPLTCDLQKCHRSPLVLAYDAAHFSALVLMADENDHVKQNEADSDEYEPPYSIMPITYSNLDLLDVHFAYDPGETYEWSDKCIDEQSTLEMSRDEKLYLLQKYLNLVKIQLTDLTHVNIININVAEPKQKVSKAKLTSNQVALTHSDTLTSKSKLCGSKIKNFFNLFKKSESRHKLDEKVMVKSSKLLAHNTTVRAHAKRVQQFKSWNALFDKLHPDTCILAATLSLNKPLKYAKIVENYINSAKEKFNCFKREQKLHQQHQQQVALKQRQQQQHKQLNNNDLLNRLCQNENCSKQIDFRFDKNYCKNCSLNY